MAQRTTSKSALEQIKPTKLVGFHQRLDAWYNTHGRHELPWRNTDDPYRIWLSEVMLQQTQVSTVLARFYHPFLDNFPTVKALANAPREQVMKAWEGLGYYSRARNLHEAAKQIINPLPAGVGRAARGVRASAQKALTLPPAAGPSLSRRERVMMPTTVDELLLLPGIGKNTAHAIAAFAYHQPVPILEANVKRVVARIFALKTPSDIELWQGADRLLNATEPFHYNQAMMDLGSLVCTPKKPDCPVCPANLICKGKAAPEQYPTKRAKKEVPTREVIIHVQEDALGRFFLETRDAKLLGGLYGFPQSPYSARYRGSPASPTERGKRSAATEREGYLGTVTHTYSHFKLIGHVCVETMKGNPNSPDWYSRAQIAGLPLSKLDHKVLALIDTCNTSQKKRYSPAKARQAH